MNSPKNFQDWALGYSGCDGGDPGSPSDPSVWVCGVEWHGSHDRENILAHVQSIRSREVSHPPQGYSDWKNNVNHRFNQDINKILAARAGFPVHNYKKFAFEKQPFVSGSRGYFKMNLFPMPFPDMKHGRWFDDLSKITGFRDKAEYLQWCKMHRLPTIAEWTNIYKPRAVIGVGVGEIRSHCAAFRVQPRSWKKEKINGSTIRWAINDCGSIVFVLPFPTAPKAGLLKDKTKELVGKRIAELDQKT